MLQAKLACLPSHNCWLKYDLSISHSLTNCSQTTTVFCQCYRCYCWQWLAVTVLQTLRPMVHVKCCMLPTKHIRLAAVNLLLHISVHQTLTPLFMAWLQCRNKGVKNEQHAVRFLPDMGASESFTSEACVFEIWTNSTRPDQTRPESLSMANGSTAVSTGTAMLHINL